MDEGSKRIEFDALVEDRKEWFAAAGSFVVTWSGAEIVLDALLAACLGIESTEVGRALTLPMNAARKFQTIKEFISMNPMGFSSQERQDLHRAIVALDNARTARRDVAHGYFSFRDIDAGGKGVRFKSTLKDVQLDYPTEHLMNLAWWTDRHALFIYEFMMSKSLVPKSFAQILVEKASTVSDSGS